MNAAEVLYEHRLGEHWDAQHDGWRECACRRQPWSVAHLLDMLRAAGVAVVELPEPYDSCDEGVVEFGDDADTVSTGSGQPYTNGLIYTTEAYEHTVDSARALAANLLAAADYAERQADS